MSVPVLAEGQAPAEVAWTVEAGRLGGLLRRVKDSTVTLSFDSSRSVSAVSVGSSDVEFVSLDPSAFPFWEHVFPEASLTARLSAKRLASALRFSNRFTSNGETEKPELCVSEVHEGLLYSGDMKVVATVRVAGLESATFRVFCQHVRPLAKFLGSCGDDEVELLENEQALFVRRADGAVFGEAKYQFKFPVPARVDVASDREWVVPVESVNSGG